MRGVNLNVFDFDYDLEWAALVLTPDEFVLGRFGGRDPVEPARYLTFSGLRYFLEENLQKPKPAPAAQPLIADRVENYSAIERLKDNACVHCHQAFDFRRQALIQAGKWKKGMAWVYPLPDN